MKKGDDPILSAGILHRLEKQKKIFVGLLFYCLVIMVDGWVPKRKRFTPNATELFVITQGWCLTANITAM